MVTVIGRPRYSNRNTWIASWGLTHPRVSLILPMSIAERLEAVSRETFWRYMARQLRRVGVDSTTERAWRAFAD